MFITSYRVTGMSCGHCERSVRDQLSSVPGVDRIEVSSSTGGLTIQSSVPLDDAQIVASVADAGYRAERIGSPIGSGEITFTKPSSKD
jgi:copper chaperone CopZ